MRATVSAVPYVKPYVKYMLQGDFCDRDDIKSRGGWSERGASGLWRFVVSNRVKGFESLVADYNGYALRL
jgi:hypothetical protein